jgi:hypothetical protein
MASDRVVTTADHNQTAAEPSPWPFSGRGERRPQTARAARTNHPLEPPAALRGRGQSAEFRRWRDLCHHFGQRLGPKRLADEATRALLLNLIWVTLQIERMRDAPLAQQPPTHTQLHCVQEQRTLLQALGLNAGRNDDSPNALRNYLNNEEAQP